MPINGQKVDEYLSDKLPPGFIEYATCRDQIDKKGRQQ